MNKEENEQQKRGIPFLVPFLVNRSSCPIYDLVIQPLGGEACGYFADGILVGGYN